MRFALPSLLAGLLCAALLSPARAADADARLAQRGQEFLRKYCSDCHGERQEKPPLDVGRRDVLLAPRKRAYVVAGKPEASWLWQRVEDGSMPPEGRPEPSDEEKQDLRAWIEAGAPFPAAAGRAFKSDRDVLAAIAGHLRRTPAEDRPFQRYFTLAHLANNPGVREEDLGLCRAALAKLVNSLSWQPGIVVPQAVDPEGTIYSVDLRRVGWSGTGEWAEIVRSYPYGLRYDSSPDAEMRELDREVVTLSGSDLPYLRADWFTAAASRPPLYHTLLRLPETAGELERLLNVGVAVNFRANRAVRAGFLSSGVSRENRVVERHPSRYGAYWKSYDFQASTGVGNIQRFPLGPDFKGNPFAPSLAFKQAGGEIIFNLPNGLQGYLLVNDKDRRIDRAPIAIVRDDKEAAGTPEVVNGLSCMSCHQRGMIGGFRDVVRTGPSLDGEAAGKVYLLYRGPDVMDRLVQQDEDRFLSALARAVGPFAAAPSAGGKGAGDAREPIAAAARRYFADLDARAAACELDFEDVGQLQDLLRREPDLLRQGLAPRPEGAVVKRQQWEQVEGTSLYQEAARLLGRGTPVVELKAR
jgi:serine/threonine-protein kinase